MERSKVAIIVPCFNEEKTIIKVVNNLINYGVPIIINDNSSDSSLELLKSIKEKIILFSNEKNLGYEKTLQVGFEIAEKNNFEIAITIDADNQFDYLDLELLLEKSKEFDIVIAERQKLQRFGEYLFSILFDNLYKIRDPLSGLKLYKLQLFRENNKIFDSQSLIGTELLLRSLKKGKKISTIKVKTVDRLDESRYGNSFKANIKIITGLLKILKIILVK